MKLGYLHKYPMADLNRTEVKCVKEGCPEKDALSKYEYFAKNHHENCVPKTTLCPLQCGQEVSNLTSQEHLTNCPKKLVKCV